jgi:hypothetical protein
MSSALPDIVECPWKTYIYKYASIGLNAQQSGHRIFYCYMAQRVVSHQSEDEVFFFCLNFWKISPLQHIAIAQK